MSVTVHKTVIILNLVLLLHTVNDSLFIGKELISLDTVDSTNNYAKGILSKSKPSEGTAIFAHYQMEGRGQYGKTWESERDKNLIFSIILYPNFLPPEKVFLLNQAVSLALRDFVFKYCPSKTISVKWPNDIYCGHQKIAGILIENSISNNRITNSVIGIGVNVNQTSFKNESSNPTSMKLATGVDFDLKNLLQEVFISLEQRYLQLKAGNYTNIEKEYTGNLLQKSLYK